MRCRVLLCCCIKQFPRRRIGFGDMDRRGQGSSECHDHELLVWLFLVALGYLDSCFWVAAGLLCGDLAG